MRTASNGTAWGGVLKTVAATAAFAAVHSILASSVAKRAVERGLGTRRRNAFYRAFYNAQSALTTGALVLYIRSLPNRTLYHIHGPAAGIMRGLQAASLAAMVDSAWRIGIGRLSGLSGLAAWFRGERDIPREPEAQSLPPTPGGSIRPVGMFAWSRHPLNLAPIPLLWLNPRMTVRLLSFNAVATLYFYLGSLHSEHRLRQVYGRAYEMHRRSRVPFFLPWPSSQSRRGPIDALASTG